MEREREGDKSEKDRRKEGEKSREGDRRMEREKD